MAISDTLAINSSNYVFAGTDKEVFLSTNSGADWTKINNGLIKSNINSLAINSDDYIFAGTYGEGVFLLNRQWDKLDTSQ